MNKNKVVINLRNAHREGILTKQQFNTLKGQVLSGRERSAVKGFMSIMKQKNKNVGELT